MNGVFVVPGNDAVVHHVLVFTDPKGKSLEKADATQSYDCFGGVSVDDSQLLTAWAPGGIPMECPFEHRGNAERWHAARDAGALPPAQRDRRRLRRHAPSTPLQRHCARVQRGQRVDRQLPRSSLEWRRTLPGPDDPASGPAFVIPANARATPKPCNTRSKPLTYPPHLRRACTASVVTCITSVSMKRSRSNTVTVAALSLMQIPRWDFDWQRRWRLRRADRATACSQRRRQVQHSLHVRQHDEQSKVATSLLERGIAAPRAVSLGESTLTKCASSASPRLPSAVSRPAARGQFAPRRACDFFDGHARQRSASQPSASCRVLLKTALV